jgi:Putative transposase/Transposase zinc-binding domain
MITLNDIFRQYGPAYRAQYTDRMLPSHRAAMTAIEGCRTEALGGHVYTCAACATTRYSYHSCKNRHCPTCQQDTAQVWLARQQDLLLPVPYFLVTFTLPPTLRDLARTHQRQLYTLLFRASAAALQQLAHDPRFLGGQIGMLGVLQTWTRDLRFHPHVHYLVPALGLAADGTVCRPRNPAFLVPVKAVAILFRAKLRAALRQTALYAHVPPETWRQAWVVDCRAVGSGAAALKYLAPYIFRVALSNNRIVGVQNDRVTFRYRDGETKQMRTCTLPALTFMGRFLQHVLPKGFVKVRYYGLFSRRQRQMLTQIRQRLLLAPPRTDAAATVPPRTPAPATPVAVCCPVCGQLMQVVVLRPVRSRSPPAVPR